MNANLKEYIRLCKLCQKEIREGIGEWSHGDMYHCPRDNRDYCKIKIVEEGYFDSEMYDQEHKLGAWVKPEPCCPDVAIRLPQVHDLHDAKRGLWGMVDWSKVECFTGYNGEITIAKRGSCEHISHQLPPELALLKCLIHQWGLEDRG